MALIMYLYGGSGRGNDIEKLREPGYGLPALVEHAPIGLDIGADSPEEIAVSILAEILAALRHRSGRSLMEAKG